MGRYYGSPLNLYDFEARFYNYQQSRFMQPDPLAEKRFSISPYAYCSNNPINRIDPDGLTDYTLNKKTGEVAQVGELNNEPDRILRTNRKGEIQYKKNGEAKVAADNIEQGILKDGMNFRDENNLFAIGKYGQSSEEGVESFVLQLSSYIGKEVGAAYFSKEGEAKNSYVSIGLYRDNEAKKTKSYGQGLGSYASMLGDEMGKIRLAGIYHTHPSTGVSISDRMTPSKQDLLFRDNILRYNSNIRVFILTAPTQYKGKHIKLDFTNH